jgi:hypothetical protein
MRAGTTLAIIALLLLILTAALVQFLFTAR